MTIIVEDGTIVEYSNSYVTVSGVDSYAIDYGYSDWTASSTSVKGVALLKAMRYIEGLSFKGVRSTESQSLSFPRSDLYDKDGYLIADDSIPAVVVKAVCECSILSLPTSDIELQPAQTSDDKRSKLNIADVITEEWRAGVSRDKSTVVMDLLKGLVKSSTTIEVERG